MLRALARARANSILAVVRASRGDEPLPFAAREEPNEGARRAAPSVRSFTEGFDTLDLRDAKAILDAAQRKSSSR
jgi:hypothetical protein